MLLKILEVRCDHMDIEKAEKKNEMIKEAAAVLSCEPEQLPEIIKKLQREIKEFNNSINNLK